MGKYDHKSLYADFYHKIMVEILNERITHFKDYHGRTPTLKDESDMYESIGRDEVKERMAKLTGGFVDPNFSIEITKHII